MNPADGMQISNDTLVTLNFGLLAALAGALWKTATVYTETRMNHEFLKTQINSAFDKIRSLEAKIK